jgi:hypothetical protein
MGISDAAYMYTYVGGNLTPLKTKYSDNAGNVGGIPAGDFFVLTGQDQVVQDTNVTFNDTVNVLNKVVCPVFDGTANYAKYADLAENYESDKLYDAGTVLFPGEITEATVSSDNGMPLGVVSENPGYLLNSSPKYAKYVPIALKGRVKVKITNTAKRGDIIVPDRNKPGFAKSIGNKASTLAPVDYLGLCITGSDKSEEGFCEIKV